MKSTQLKFNHEIWRTCAVCLGEFDYRVYDCCRDCEKKYFAPVVLPSTNGAVHIEQEAGC